MEKPPELGSGAKKASLLKLFYIHHCLKTQFAIRYALCILLAHSECLLRPSMHTVHVLIKSIRALSPLSPLRPGPVQR